MKNMLIKTYKRKKIELSKAASIMAANKGETSKAALGINYNASMVLAIQL